MFLIFAKELLRIGVDFLIPWILVHRVISENQWTQVILSWLLVNIAES